MPRFHKECQWYEVSCDICGRSLRVNREWDNPPKAHEECKRQRAAQWRETSCEHCHKAIRYHVEWNRVPRFHKECLWYEAGCEFCFGKVRVNRGSWQSPPKMCDSCKERFKPRDISCKQCGRSFTIKTGTLIKCHQEHWDPPTTCQECKSDLLLIKGAIGALKGQFPIALETTIEARGYLLSAEGGHRAQPAHE